MKESEEGKKERKKGRKKKRKLGRKKEKVARICFLWQGISRARRNYAKNISNVSFRPLCLSESSSGHLKMHKIY